MHSIIDKIVSWDQELFLFLNSFHTASIDPVMLWVSEKYTWIPFYAVILAFIIWHYKVRSIVVLIGVALVILFADQLTSGFMKPFFERLRPCHEPVLEGLVYLAKGCGGKFGFASSHAANTFGVAMFLWMLFKTYRWAFLIFVWATVVSYSRIYLGVHYPLDIIVGGLLGILIAWLVYKIFEKIIFKNKPNYLLPVV